MARHGWRLNSRKCFTDLVERTVLALRQILEQAGKLWILLTCVFEQLTLLRRQLYSLEQDLHLGTRAEHAWVLPRRPFRQPALTFPAGNDRGTRKEHPLPWVCSLYTALKSAFLGY